MDGHKLSLTSRLSAGSTYQICRICHAEAPYDAEAMVSPCHCAGSLKYVHQECLQQWIKSSNAKSCEICKFQYSMHTKTRPFRQWERLELDRTEKRRLCMSLAFQTLALFCIGWSIYLIADRNTYDGFKTLNTSNDASLHGPSTRALSSSTFNAIILPSSSSPNGGTTTTMLLTPSSSSSSSTSDGSSSNNNDSTSNATFNWPFWAKLSIFALGFAGGFGFMYIQVRMYIGMCRKWQAYNKLIYVRNCPDRSTLPAPSSRTQAQANLQQEQHSHLSQSLGNVHSISKPSSITAIPSFSTKSKDHFLFEHGSHHTSAPSVAIISSTAAQITALSGATSSTFDQPISSSSSSSSSSGATTGGGLLMLTTTNGRHIPGAVVTPNMMMMSSDHHQPSSTVITITPGNNSTGAAVALKTTAGAQTATLDGYYSALTVYHHHHVTAAIAAPQPPILATPLVVQQQQNVMLTSNQIVNNPNAPDISTPGILSLCADESASVQPTTAAPNVTLSQPPTAVAAPAVCHHHHHHHYCTHFHHPHEQEEQQQQQQQQAQQAVLVVAPEAGSADGSGGDYSAITDCFFGSNVKTATEPFVHVHAVTNEVV